MSIHEEQTLHDFVLGLLNDPASRLAFTEDPTDALECAGLGDITAQDVQEVVPLVMDYSGQLPGTDALGDLPVGADGIAGAIAQLQSVADVAGEQRSDDALDFGVFDADLEGSADGVAGAGELVTDQVHAVGAATASTEGGQLAGSVVSDAGAGEIVGEVSEDGASFASTSDSVLGQFAGIGGAGLESAGGSVAYEGDAANGAGTVDASLQGISGDLDFATEQAGIAAFTEGSTDGAAGGVALDGDAVELEGTAGATAEDVAAGGSIETPAGTYGIAFAGSPSEPSLPDFATTGDLAGALDSESLTRGFDPAASTLAVVTSDSAALGGLGGLGGVVPAGLPAVPALPETGSLPVDLPAERADLPVDAPIDVPAELPADLPVDLPADLPAVGDLPVDVPGMPGLPGLGELPVDLPTDLPALGDLPVDLPTDLPGGLPVDLPTELPELPVANPLPDRADLPADVPAELPGDPVGTVTDSVGASPLGDVAGVTDALPTDLPDTGDLGLGL
ncbi:IniB N-terminal domain-containing protein [Prauserella cavernicola]|uniref:IniB N-terminal domain-containing protein n=1 Tax=Prauserella cavernicola TaxID=2800127 RepID=A0A934QRM4_9PSEU|nr:IniB N-terminal domain-containing protein [Prauserella cavernicola]MBK1784997.1 IniB N-terminal domain-containing protein [Prauserella cavernicola]